MQPGLIDVFIVVMEILVKNKITCGNCNVMLTSTNHQSCNMLSTIGWITLVVSIMVIIVGIIGISRRNCAKKDYKLIQ